MSDLSDTISDVANNPKKLEGDQGNVTEHDLKQLIEADKYLASKNATKSQGFPVKMFKISPGSAVGG